MSKPNKKAAHAGSRGAARAMANQRSNSNSAEAQRKRLLSALERSSVTTIHARRDLDILCPAARVMELRRMGHTINTVWTHEATDCGKVHRVARYVLMGRA